MEDLGLDRIEERELRLVKSLKVRVIQSCNSDRSQRQKFGIRIILCWHCYVS